MIDLQLEYIRKSFSLKEVIGKFKKYPIVDEDLKPVWGRDGCNQVDQDTDSKSKGNMKIYTRSFRLPIINLTNCDILLSGV